MSTSVDKEKKVSDTTIILRNVRIAFPDLWTAVQYEGKGPFSYRATFLIDPKSAEHSLVQETIQKVAIAGWGVKAKEVLLTIEGQSQKFCYIDGNTKGYDGYENMWALSTSRPQESGRPKVIDQRKNDLTVDDGKPYGGCIVNAKVQLWPQNNKFGRGLRASLIAVQFAKDGDAFGGAPPASDTGMEEVADSGDDLI